MKVILIILAIVVVLLILYLLSIRPNTYSNKRTDRRDILKKFGDKYIAHRGVYDNEGDVPENSIPAFKEAVERGYGVELDVQADKDGDVVVFHDGNLKRMTGKDRKICECSYDELKQYRLGKSDERIPLFNEVLKLMNPDTPLLVEIKNDGNWLRNTVETVKILDNYNGVYCIQTFDPRILHWLKINRPEIVRGQLANHMAYKEKKRELFIRFFLANLVFNFYGKPDFISYNHKYKNQFSYKIMRKLYKCSNACWTIKNEKQLEKARDTFDIIIFDSFHPEV